MRLTRSAIQVHWRGKRFGRPRGMHAAVSLHSHSDCSREKLSFVPGIARSIPLVAALFEREMANYRRLYGRELDFSAVYWRPPMSAAAVIASEREQAERRFDCDALVSLTDHDTSEGPRALRATGHHTVPLSLEWTVPFDGAVFHLGVHCLPAASLDSTERALAAYTSGATRNLGELLDWIGECPETFVVLNHPLWDLAELGALQHESTLLAFLRLHRDRIHALELNGHRSWNENRRVLPLAEGFRLPVVGGGDRHGRSPNSIINLTGATCLAEFAHELRTRRPTHCVVLPEYCQPFAARIMHTATDALRCMPDHHRGCRHWSERVFITINGVERSLASMWNRPPRWLSSTIAMTLALGSPAMRPLFELMRADGHHTLDADCPGEVAPDAVLLETPGAPALVSASVNTAPL